MKKTLVQGIVAGMVLLFAIVIDLMVVKEPWKAVPELQFIFEWGYGLALAVAMNIPAIIGALAVREYEQKLIDKKRFALYIGMILVEVTAAFTLNMAVGVYMQTNWVAVLKHAVPILTSLLVCLTAYSIYDPIEFRLDILDYRYDKLYAQISELEREIEKIGDPCTNEKRDLAEGIDHYMEFIDHLDANARKMKVKVRKYFMRRLDDEDAIAKLSRSSQELMDGRTFKIEAEAEYQEFTRRYN